MNKFIEKFCKRFDFEPSEVLGFIFALCAIAIACFNYRYGIFNSKKATGRPDIMSGLFAFIFTAVLYWRGLIAFTNSNKIGRLVSIIVNVSIFATLFSLIFHATKNWEKDILLIVTMTACATSLLFGMKGIAKIVMIISLLILSIKSLVNLDEAMGGWGFAYELLVFSSFYFQGNVNFSGLRDELKILYGKAVYTIKESSEEAVSELKEVGDVIKETGKEVVKKGTMV